MIGQKFQGPLQYYFSELFDNTPVWQLVNGKDAR